jgi:hypothetical protein
LNWASTSAKCGRISTGDLENLKSFDEFLERRFPESRTKAYYLMSIHYAFSSIDRLNGHQHPHLRRDLNHLSAFRQARSRLAQSGGAAAFHWMRTLPPRKDSNSMTHSLGVATCGAISSTKAGLLAFRRSRGTPPSRFFSPT